MLGRQLSFLPLALFAFPLVCGGRDRARAHNVRTRTATTASPAVDGELQTALFAFDAAAARRAARRGGTVPADTVAMLLDNFCFNGWAGLVDVLLTDLHADANIFENGRFPLHTAVAGWDKRNRHYHGTPLRSLPALLLLTPFPPAHLPPENHGEVVRLLLDHEADPGRRDGSGRTAVHLAARVRAYDALEAMLGERSPPRFRTIISAWPFFLNVSLSTFSLKSLSPPPPPPRPASATPRGAAAVDKPVAARRGGNGGPNQTALLLVVSDGRRYLQQSMNMLLRRDCMSAEGKATTAATARAPHKKSRGPGRRAGAGGRGRIGQAQQQVDGPAAAPAVNAECVEPAAGMELFNAFEQWGVELQPPGDEWLVRRAGPGRVVAILHTSPLHHH